LLRLCHTDAPQSGGQKQSSGEHIEYSKE